MFNVSVKVIENRTQFAVGVGAQSAPLEAGVYDVVGEADTYIAVRSENADDVTSSDGYFIPADTIVSIRIGRDGLRIGSTAAIKCHRVG